MNGITFLTFDEVLQIHRRHLDVYGGRDGFIDRSIVESATAQPQASMFGQYLHEDIAHMAAAYLFHFAAAQGFVDGNKSTAAGVCDDLPRAQRLRVGVLRRRAL